MPLSQRRKGFRFSWVCVLADASATLACSTQHQQTTAAIEVKLTNPDARLACCNAVSEDLGALAHTHAKSGIRSLVARDSAWAGMLVSCQRHRVLNQPGSAQFLACNSPALHPLSSLRPSPALHPIIPVTSPVLPFTHPIISGPSRHCSPIHIWQWKWQHYCEYLTSML